LRLAYATRVPANNDYAPMRQVPFVFCLQFSPLIL
jgi:hypothetical protein